jgi:hypothetical protein
VSYSTLAHLAKDADFLERVTACVATQGIQQADKWADDNRWTMAAQPGFDEAYAYAVSFENPAPGKDLAVITDEQILAAVQSLLRGN